MLILSGGKDEKVKPAINSIRYAVVGIIVIVIAIFVAPKVSEMLGLGTHQYLSPQNIFNTIKNYNVLFFHNIISFNDIILFSIVFVKHLNYYFM